MKMRILNSEGKEIVLNAREQRVADLNQKAVNALGYEIDITSLTTIMKKITEQKFFEIPPADFIPVRVGDGAWSTQLTTYRSFSLADDFSTGVLNLGSNNGKLATGDAAVDAMNIKVNNWAKSIGWTLFDLESAAKSGNWDLVAAKEKARKKNWDLGIQKIAFLGLSGDASVLGMYNQSGVTNNTTLITKLIRTMTAAEMSTMIGGLLPAYRANCAYTAWPTHFIIPEDDFLGLGVPYSSDFPNVSKLDYLTAQLRVLTKNPNFQILPCAYGSTANGGPATAQRYVLLNYDEESLRMDIPVDYTSTLANSVDNFSFQNVGYGQFTGVLAYRPLEMLYFSF